MEVVAMDRAAMEVVAMDRAAMEVVAMTATIMITTIKPDRSQMDKTRAVTSA